jgi:hypothetical protein
MNLREDALYLRLSTFQDLLNSAAALRACDLIQDALGVRFTHTQDLGVTRRDRPLSPVPTLAALTALTGQGVNAAAHIKLLSSADPDASPWLDLLCGPHPYTGRYRVALDLRLHKALASRPQAAAQLTHLMASLCDLCAPAAAHAHDADDNTTQNIRDPNLLRRAFGVEPPDDPDDRPGMEVNLGELRYVVNWLTALGPEQVEALGGPDHLRATPCPLAQPLPNGGWLFQLYDDPLSCASPSSRAIQRAVALHWDLPQLARAQGPTLAYWNRKSWRT